MKKFILLIVLVLCCSGLSFAGPSFDSATGILTVPTLDIDGSKFQNVQLKLNGNGSYQVLDIQPTSYPISEYVYLGSPNLDAVFSLNDGSVWIIKGGPYSKSHMFSDKYFYGTTLTIYNIDASSMDDPAYGAKTNYMMLISAPGYGLPLFIEPL